MKFLVDENQSPLVAETLREAGHDAVHVRDLGLSGASDQELLDLAEEQDRVVLSADTDFGELLARTNASAPSVLLLRQRSRRRATQVAALVVSNLVTIEDDLIEGAVVVLDDDRIRVRRLPFFETE